MLQLLGHVAAFVRNFYEEFRHSVTGYPLLMAQSTIQSPSELPIRLTLKDLSDGTAMLAWSLPLSSPQPSKLP
jgi:hypothetical protein